MRNHVHFVNRGLLFSCGCLQRLSMWGKSSLCKKCHNLDIWSESRMRQPSVPLTFSVLRFPMPLRFDLSKLPCVVLIVLTQHLLLCLAAYCISLNSIAVSLLCIWTGATFWSVAPLLGWGSYTGLMPMTVFFFTSPSSPSSIITLCSSSVLRSRLRHVWGGLVQSQLLHHSQVLHYLHPHLLLFHPRDDHALLLRLHHKNGEEHQRHVSWRLSHPTPEEGGERRHQGGFQFYISVLKSCTSILPTPVPYRFPLILA